MSRTAEIDRTTGETDIRCGWRSTAPARHARDRRRLLRPHARRARRATALLDLDVRGHGRPRDRRAPHGRGRRASCSARRSPRRSATRRHPRFGARRRADGRGARLRAPSTSRAGRSAPTTVDAARSSIGTFDTDAGQGVPARARHQRRLTLHVPLLAGEQRAPHHRGGVQGVRARAARGRRARPRRAGVPSHEGRAVSSAHRDRRLPDGQPAQRRRRASSTPASRRRVIASDPTRSRAADGIVLPGVGAFRDGAAQPARARRRGPDRASGSGPARRSSASASGCSCSSTSARGRRVGGPRPAAAATCERCRRRA